MDDTELCEIRQTTTVCMYRYTAYCILQDQLSIRIKARIILQSIPFSGRKIQYLTKTALKHYLRPAKSL